MKKMLIMLVLVVGIGGNVSENAHAGIGNWVMKVVTYGTDALNFAFEPTPENAVGMAGDTAGSYVGRASGAYAGGAVGSMICPGAGSAAGAFIGGCAGGIIGGAAGEKAAKEGDRRFK